MYVLVVAIRLKVCTLVLFLQLLLLVVLLGYNYPFICPYRDNF